MTTDGRSFGEFRRGGRRQPGFMKARRRLLPWSRSARRLWLRIVRRDDAEGAAFRIFSENFERGFRRVFLYVSRRVSDRKILERIVHDVLEENLDILVVPGDVRREVEQLRASADRLIAQVKGQLDAAATAHHDFPRGTIA
jgi:hypothetical protein